MDSLSVVAEAASRSPEFLSQAVARKFAATAAGSELPTLEPEKRPPVVPIVAGEP